MDVEAEEFPWMIPGAHDAELMTGSPAGVHDHLSWIAGLTISSTARGARPSWSASASAIR